MNNRGEGQPGTASAQYMMSNNLLLLLTRASVSILYVRLFCSLPRLFVDRSGMEWYFRVL